MTERSDAGELFVDLDRPGRPDEPADVVRAIEAIVLVATEPVPPDLLAQLLELPVVTVEELCRRLAEAYDEAGHGFQLVRVAGGYRYQSHPDLAPYVERFVLEGQSARLSAAALETLAIVAYKQPISRAQIASIRGVDPDAVLRTLQSRGYVDQVGRDPGPGQAVLWGTTGQFLERLGLDSVAELPPIADFVPGAEVVEALETGLRVDTSLHLDEGADMPARTAGRRGPTAALGASLHRPPTVVPERQPDGPGDGSTGERLQKVLAQRGYGSRRVCEDLIASGRVHVNGQLARLGWRVLVDHDRVEVDGHPVTVKPGLVHYLLNKPAGVVTTSKDTHGRPTVVDLVPAEPRVFPVGRLDAETEGLLLLTNDGELAHRLTHPSFGVEKEYLAQVARPLGPGALRRLREGIELEDGQTAPAEASQPTPGLVRITIHEGRNRQVRRMLRRGRAPGASASCGCGSVPSRTAGCRRDSGAC